MGQGKESTDHALAEQTYLLTQLVPDAELFILASGDRRRPDSETTKRLIGALKQYSDLFQRKEILALNTGSSLITREHPNPIPSPQ